MPARLSSFPRAGIHGGAETWSALRPHGCPEHRTLRTEYPFRGPDVAGCVTPATNRIPATGLLSRFARDYPRRLNPLRRELLRRTQPFRLGGWVPPRQRNLLAVAAPALSHRLMRSHPHGPTLSREPHPQKLAHKASLLSGFANRMHRRCGREMIARARRAEWVSDEP